MQVDNSDTFRITVDSFWHLYFLNPLYINGHAALILEDALPPSVLNPPRTRKLPLNETYTISRMFFSFVNVFVAV